MSHGAIRRTLLYSHETRSTGVEDCWRVEVLDHWCLRSILKGSLPVRIADKTTWIHFGFDPFLTRRHPSPRLKWFKHIPPLFLSKWVSQEMGIWKSVRILFSQTWTCSTFTWSTAPVSNLDKLKTLAHCKHCQSFYFRISNISKNIELAHCSFDTIQNAFGCCVIGTVSTTTRILQPSMSYCSPSKVKYN